MVLIVPYVGASLPNYPTEASPPALPFENATHRETVVKR